MDLAHHMFKLGLNGGIFRAPITTKPQHVLDLGTGTGIWAIEFADTYPSSRVIGTDLSVFLSCNFNNQSHQNYWSEYLKKIDTGMQLIVI